MKITTTLNRVSLYEDCTPVLAKLLTQLGKKQADDEPLPFTMILDHNGLDDTLLCCQAEPQHEELWWHFAVVCIESVKHMMSSRSLDILPAEWDWVKTQERLAAPPPPIWESIGQGRPDLSERAFQAIQAARLTVFLAELNGNDPVGVAHARAREAAAVAAMKMSCNKYTLAASHAVKAIETPKVRTRVTEHFRRIVTAGWAPVIVKEYR